MIVSKKAYMATDMKEMNRKSVYKILTSVNEISKAEISRMTGISSPTVMKIMNHFIKTGLVKETDPCKTDNDNFQGYSGPGRRPNLVHLNKNAAFLIGAEFEGNYLKIGIFNLAYELIAFDKLVTNDNFETILTKRLPAAVEAMIDTPANVKNKRILGIGIGIPSIFDPESMVIEATPLIGIHARIEAVYLLTTLKERLGIPVFMENDVKAAAIGEYRTHGAGKKDLVYVSLGTGVGAGIILDGKLRKGLRNIAGEIGYIAQDTSIENTILTAGWLERNTNLAALKGMVGDLDQLDLNDDIVLKSIEKVAGHIGLATANLCNTLDIDTVILGGVLVELLGDALTDRICTNINKLSLMPIQTVSSALQQPGIKGAAHIVMDHMLDSLLAE